MKATSNSIKITVILIIGIIINVNAQKQNRDDNYDAIILLKNSEQIKTKIWANDRKNIYTQPNLKGAVAISDIDTITLINENNFSLKELVWRIPIKLINGMEFSVRDLFIEDLPYSVRGELLFLKSVKLNDGETNTLFDRLISIIKNYTEDAHIHEANRSSQVIRAKIVHPLSPATRASTYLFYERSAMTTQVQVIINDDSLNVSVNVIEYEFNKIIESTNKIIEGEKLYPNDLFRKQNYFAKGKALKFNSIMKNETIGIIDSFLKTLTDY